MAAGAENSPAILIGVENDGEDVGYLVDITGGYDGFMHRRVGALDIIGRQRVAIGIENFVFDIFIFRHAKQLRRTFLRGVKIGIHVGVGIVLNIIRHQRLGAVKGFGDGGHLEERINLIFIIVDFIAQPIEGRA